MFSLFSDVRSVTNGDFYCHSQNNMGLSTDRPVIVVSRHLYFYLILKQSFYLRDTLDVMSTRKIRETTDFDWRRNTRLYYQEIEGNSYIPKNISSRCFILNDNHSLSPYYHKVVYIMRVWFFLCLQTRRWNLWYTLWRTDSAMDVNFMVIRLE